MLFFSAAKEKISSELIRMDYVRLLKNLNRKFVVLSDSLSALENWNCMFLASTGDDFEFNPLYKSLLYEWEKTGKLADKVYRKANESAPEDPVVLGYRSFNQGII